VPGQIIFSTGFAGIGSTGFGAGITSSSSSLSSSESESIGATGFLGGVSGTSCEARRSLLAAVKC